jgi:hypothetical protein
MRLPVTSSALLPLALALLGPMVALGPGCGTPPAKDPSPAAADSSPDLPKQDTPGIGTPPKSTAAAGSSTAASGPSSPASSSPGAMASAGPAGNDRLEDKTFVKSNSTGGQYSVIVLSVAGLDTTEVGTSLGNASPGSDACYSTFFKTPLKAPGSTVFEITVSAKGKSQSVKLKSDDIKDAPLVKCLDGVLKGVHWPPLKEKGNGKTTVEWRVKGP